MKYAIVFLLSVLCFQFGNSQIYEFGVFVGGSNLIGDVGKTNYIAPNKTAFGGVFKWNRSARHSFRASLIYSELEALDSESDDPRRIERGFEYRNNSFIEFSAGIEFTFFDFNLHNPGAKSTPYLYTGISLASHDNYYFNGSGVQTSENTKSIAYGIPMIVGFKTTLTDLIILAGEIGARYTFSDELDGSVPDSEALIAQRAFGNLNNNDWYVFTGITLTYTFGRNPCYCGY